MHKLTDQNLCWKDPVVIDNQWNFLQEASLKGQAMQAGDKSFKEELGKIIDVDIWENAKELVLSELTSLQQRLQSLQSKRRQDEDYLEQLQIKVQLLPGLGSG